MIHVTCPHCASRIPAERFRDGNIVIPEYLICDVCGRRFEQLEHTGSEEESVIQKLIEKIDGIWDEDKENAVIVELN